MNTMTRTAALGGAGLLSAALIAFAAPVSVAQDAKDSENTAFKRSEDTPDVVQTVDDDDDDDTGNTNTNGDDDTRTNGQNSGTGNSNDGTNSRVTDVSRDQDRSRGDKTKDWTNDGPGKQKRDFSQNQTNDGSRNDTR